ncbi:hypothetical protein C1I95_32135 [Micromonospora craterilacus]|uniref:Uncharacterized protein n=1 Tax=Micromonospora craterilacus TaxID=1655439 RepID=A0A2W2D5X2_9ACTN|nr:hypothetical protein [Micromonospora craterilacus]PZG06283.1 hypothetical protein C1I95_32135 [Micromonospora craterilacus]
MHHLDAVGITDIAKRAGVKPDTVKKWIARHPDFPAPAGSAARGRLWDWPEVYAWIRDTKRARFVRVVDVQSSPDGRRTRGEGTLRYLCVGPAAVQCAVEVIRDTHHARQPQGEATYTSRRVTFDPHHQATGPSSWQATCHLEGGWSADELRQIRDLVTGQSCTAPATTPKGWPT